jgi:putative phosphoribosyl transferase
MKVERRLGPFGEKRNPQDPAHAVRTSSQCSPPETSEGFTKTVQIPSQGNLLIGDWVMPGNACGMVLFAHGSGSSRHSSRNKAVAKVLQHYGIGTLLLDLLTPEEESVDAFTAHLRFDIGLLARRLVDATDWLKAYSRAKNLPNTLPLGYFGASTGAAAALVAAAEEGNTIQAVVSRGGRPDLAGRALLHVLAPTLLIVGGNDGVVVDLNKQALAQLRAPKEFVIIPKATHLFPEAGALEQVAAFTARWFVRYFASSFPKKGVSP